VGRVTVYEIAEAAGVSFSTAAAALRGSSVVRTRTRERVERVAAELGYRPNRAASVLASRNRRGASRSVFLAWLTVVPREDASDETFRVVAQARELAEGRGYQFEHHNLDHPREASALGEVLYARGVEGVVLGRSVRFPGRFAFPWEKFALVAEERHRVAQGFDTVRANYFAATLELLRQVAAHGYQQIGFIHREHVPRFADDDGRLGAALAFFDQHVRRPDRVPFYRTDFGESLALEWANRAPSRFSKWLEKYEPEVVVGHNAVEWEFMDSVGRGSTPFAAQAVLSEQRRKLAGLAAVKDIQAPILLERLEQKVRLGQFGLSEAPRETVFELPFVPGRSLPER